MKLSKPVAIVAVTAALVVGGTVAVQAAGDADTVRLCLDAKKGAVALPSSSGSCAKGTTAVDMASAQGLAALKATVAQQATTISDLSQAQTALQGTVTSQGNSIAGLQSTETSQGNTIAGLQGTVTSQSTRLDALEKQVASLLPGELKVTSENVSTHTFVFTVTGKELKPGANLVQTGRLDGGTYDGAVAADGTLNIQNIDICSNLPMTFRTTTEDDRAITATLSSVDGC